MSDPAQILDTIVREVDAGRRAALCVVVATRGSTPQVPGAMICVDEAAQITGTVGGGCTEAEIRRRAHELLSAESHGQTEPGQDPSSGTEHAHAGREHGTPREHGTRHDGRESVGMPPGRVFTFDLDYDLASDDGLICGGHMDVAITVVSQPAEAKVIRAAAERLRAGEAATLPLRVQTSDGLAEYRVHLEAPPKLVIAGGGHIGRVLAEMMVPLGFRVSVVDDRIEFANADRFPSPIEPLVGDIAETLKRRPIDTNTYIVIVTRGHKHDEQALGAVIDSPAKYIGMIGSRRKIEIIYDDLKREGAAQEQIDRVHAPIGLDIKAVTPEEIAVSIAAELISARRAAYRKSVEGPVPV